MNNLLARIARLLLAASGAALVLCGGAWAGGAFAAFGEARAARGKPARALVGPSYPSGSQAPGAPGAAQGAKDDSIRGDSRGEIPLGDALTVNGQPMQLSLFTTSDPPSKVIAWYQEAFEKRGLIPIAHAEDRIGHVSVFDPEDGLQRFITALPQRTGETVVMMGVTNPRHAPRLLRGAKGAPFPVPDEHRGFLGYSSEDGGARAQSGQFVSTLSPAPLLAYYRKELGLAGFTERKGESSEALALFGHPNGTTISVAIQALGEKTGAAVFVNRIEGPP